MSLKPDIERVLAEHGLPAQNGRNLGQYRVEWDCDCGETFVADGHRGETAFDMHGRHQAEVLAALLGQHVAAAKREAWAEGYLRAVEPESDIRDNPYRAGGGAAGGGES